MLNFHRCLSFCSGEQVTSNVSRDSSNGMIPPLNIPHRIYPLPWTSDIGPTPPDADIWWPRQETCSNLFTWGPTPSNIWWWILNHVWFASSGMHPTGNWLDRLTRNVQVQIQDLVRLPRPKVADIVEPSHGSKVSYMGLRSRAHLKTLQFVKVNKWYAEWGGTGHFLNLNCEKWENIKVKRSKQKVRLGP